METIGKLALALAKAQAEIKGAKKDADNPFYKSKYADLASVWEACREALSKNELAVVQTTDIVDGALVLKTILMHSSGETIVGFMPVQVGEKATAQQIGSAITYARRYALAAMVGVAPEEDDGNAASETTAKTAYKKPAPRDDELKTKATDLVKFIELSETLDELNAVTRKNAMLMGELANKLPDWHTRLLARIDEQRDSLTPKTDA